MTMTLKGMEAKVVIAAVLLLIGLFYLYDAFIVYRVMAFNAVPHDDYVTYLEHIWTHGAAGRLPHSPYVERIGSVLMAAPFALLPSFNFSGGIAIPADQVRFAQAMSFANVFYFYAGCVVVYFSTLRMLEKSEGLSPLLIPAVILQCLVARYVMSMFAIDGVGFFLASVAAYLIVADKIWMLAVYGALVIAFNEKVTLCSLGMIAGYAVVMRKGYLAALLPAIAIAGYVAYTKVTGTGPTYQIEGNIRRDLLVFLDSCLSARGILMVILPTVALVLSGLLIERRELQAAAGAAFALLFAGAVKGEVHFDVGRVVYYISPLVIAGSAPAFARIAEQLRLRPAAAT